ncbi:hypothetical protein [Zobellia uliginosa]|uniref:hypothetical protein n=1 Tax=Zobellia uliginosa TaxID=143224 RepID=UPI0026E1E7CD|nr:hypothetical protein [Zobellia uliginosa]MDO6517774.1 hypothetical protein [Zobellia uliginosa]
MTKYILTSLILVLIVTGCDKCDGDKNNLLSDKEKGLIPFSADTSVNFTNNTSETVIGNYSQKENEITNLDSGNDGDCSATNVEREYATLELSGLELGFNIVVRKGRSNELIFVLSQSDDNNARFAVDDCDGIVGDLNNSLRNISAQGFEFTDVFVLNSCTENSMVQRVLYSSTNGIEFIEFSDGDYLMLAM